MNILFLTQEYPPETGWGGIGTYTRNVARALVQMGHSVHVLAAAVPPQTTQCYDDEGVHVVRVARWKFEVPLIRRLWFNTTPWTKHQWEYLVSVTGELKRLVQQFHIDVIESPEIWAEGLLYSFQRAAPIVVKFHTPLYMVRDLDGMRETFDWRLVDRVDAWWTRRADGYVSASADLAARVSSRYRIPLARISIVPEAVDAERFKPVANGHHRSQTILYIGRLEPRKGVFTLADAIPGVVREFPNARFVFVGADNPVDGHSSRALLTERLRAAGVADRAEFVGKVPNEEIGTYHHDSAVCVFPSDWENCAIACLEAMASGKPVIASSSGGFPDMIRTGESGLLVPPRDAGALSTAIRTMLSNPAQARDWGANARRRIEMEFSSRVVAAKTLEVYQNTIEGWKRKKERAR